MCEIKDQHPQMWCREQSAKQPRARTDESLEKEILLLLPLCECIHKSVRVSVRSTSVNKERLNRNFPPNVNICKYHWVKNNQKTTESSLSR